MNPRSALPALAGLVASALTGCVWTQSWHSYRAVQDSVLIAPRPSAPIGGALGAAGRLAFGASARLDPAQRIAQARSESVTSQRTPWASGGPFIGYAPTRSLQLGADCSFAEGARAAAIAADLPEANPHRAVVGRCGLSLAGQHSASSRARIVGGASISLASATLERLIDERVVTETRDSRTFPRSVIVEVREARYLERGTLWSGAAAMFIGVELDATDWLGFELGGALGVVPMLPGVVVADGVSSGGRASDAGVTDPLDVPRAVPEVIGQGWIGAFVGPRFLRFAVRADVDGGSAGATGGSNFGVECALRVSAPLWADSQHSASARAARARPTSTARVPRVAAERD